jgi:hypothetical protein
MTTEPRLAPVWTQRLAGETSRLLTRLPSVTDLSAGGQDPTISFFAVVANKWPAGLLPLFAVESTNGFELRRRPKRGQENFTEPLFLALPPDDETQTARITGYWDCTALRQGSKEYVGIELTLDGESLSARFDQDTQYRFAFITGGTFRSNDLHLRVEYINDVYALEAIWETNSLKGTWRHAENGDSGTWEGSRLPAKVPLQQGTVALYEWRRPTDGARIYLPQGNAAPEGWERNPHPLCRVWSGGEGRE